MNKEELIKYGTKVFKSKRAFFSWLMSPNKAMGEKIPFDLLVDNKFDEIITILGRIEHGTYS